LNEDDDDDDDGGMVYVVRIIFKVLP